MDPKTEALLQVLQQSVQVIEQARTEQGWTAGAVALVLFLALGGLAWMVRRLTCSVDELSTWRHNVLQGQVETTVRALDKSADSMTEFGAKLDANTGAMRDNTGAIHGLRDVIRAAPCGRLQPNS